MTTIFTKEELIEFISTLKEAYKKVAASGGVTSYTLNSGQGSTTVHSASLAEITTQIRIYSEMLNELLEVESGSNVTYIRDMGL